MHSGGYYKISCSFGGRFDEKWGFDVDEAEGVEVLSDFHADAVAVEEVVFEGGSAQVQIAVFHSELFASVGFIFDGEGGDFAGVEDGDLVRDYFDVASGEVGVFAGPFPYGACGLYDKFSAQLVGFVKGFRVCVLVEGELCDSVSVSEVYKGDGSQLPDALYPASKGDLLVYVVNCQFVAMMGSVHVRVVVIGMQT
jgi:hypothetical protein